MSTVDGATLILAPVDRGRLRHFLEDLNVLSISIIYAYVSKCGIRNPRNPFLSYYIELAIFRWKFMDSGNESCAKNILLVKLCFFTTKSQQHMLFPNLKTKEMFVSQKTKKKSQRHCCTRADGCVALRSSSSQNMSRAPSPESSPCHLCPPPRGSSMDGSQVSLFA